MVSMKKPTIYLAGSMTGEADRGSSWRDQATRILERRCMILDPCRLETSEMTCDEIVRFDYACILSSQAILADVRKASWGTGMELAFAKQHGIPVVAWGQPGRSSPWLVAHTKFLSTDLMIAIEQTLLLVRER